MLKRALILFACAAALAACGAPSSNDAATQTAEVRVTDEACAYSNDYDGLERIPTIHDEMVYESDDPNDANVGVVVSAPEGSSCTGSAKDDQVLTCVVTGPRATLTIQDTVVYAIPDGRNATLKVENGLYTCFLNEAAS